MGFECIPCLYWRGGDGSFPLPMAKKKKEDFESLSRREREVMYVVHRLGEVTAESLEREMNDEGFSYSASRRYLSILHDKGFVMMRKDGARYCYRPVNDTHEVGLEMLRTAFHNFFRGSATLGMASFLREEGGKKADTELEALEAMLRDTREGKNVDAKHK